MMIAHLPAGYLLARRLAPRLATGRPALRKAMLLVLAGSMFPDLDMLYFYLADGRQTLHHDYWTHIPAFWPVAAVTAVALLMLARLRVPWRALLAFLAGIFLHLALDSYTGGIAWAWPVSQVRFFLIEVPARFDWWVWSFVLHWSFLLEIAICYWAAREFGLVACIRQVRWTARRNALPRSRARQSDRG